MTLNFWQKVSHFPPILVRLLAKHRHKHLVRLPAKYPHKHRHNHGRRHVTREQPFTDEQIAKRGGLTPHQVRYFSHLTNWEGIDIPSAHKFLIGCGVDFEDSKAMHRIKCYLDKKPVPWKYLRKSKDWESFYQPLMRQYLQAVKIP